MRARRRHAPQPRDHRDARAATDSPTLLLAARSLSPPPWAAGGCATGCTTRCAITAVLRAPPGRASPRCSSTRQLRRTRAAAELCAAGPTSSASRRASRCAPRARATRGRCATRSRTLPALHDRAGSARASRALESRSTALAPADGCLAASRDAQGRARRVDPRGRRDPRRLRRRARRAARDPATTAAPSCSSWRSASARAPASPTCASSTTACTASTSRSRRSQLDEGAGRYRRRQTLKNAERYITPELKAFEDKALVGARARARAREGALRAAARRAQRPSSRDCRRSPTPLPSSTRSRRSPQRAGALGLVRARARHRATAHRDRGGPPPGGREPGRDLHPQRHEPHRARAQLLLITGPNMGGKSTYMRQVALIALLAHCGCFVPAKARAPRPDRPHLHAHRRLRRPRRRALDLHGGDDRGGGDPATTRADTSLVLMDEIGRGTSTFDGLALACAIARHLAEKNRCYTLFATHYFELTQLAEQHAEVANVHLAAAEANGIVFLHEVRGRAGEPELRPRGRTARRRAGRRRAPRARIAAATGRASARRETAARFVCSLDRGAPGSAGRRRTAAQAAARTRPRCAIAARRACAAVRAAATRGTRHPRMN